MATVSTTRPNAGSYLPLPITTDRLIIRALHISDLDAYCTLLRDPGAMEGEPIMDPAESQRELQRALPPFTTDLYLGIFLRNPNGSEGELIGDGGMFRRPDDNGVPRNWFEFGFRFKQEHWSRGYATEFGHAFMRFWWSLPRQQVSFEVAPSTLDRSETSQARERVVASVHKSNPRSESVLNKLGFEVFLSEPYDVDPMNHWLLKDYIVLS
ncbi:GNAT domain-containing protein [Hyaloscypha finlandica]|nr:GNAT domain-containing protein [Hyaloscypha finlandica]